MIGAELRRRVTQGVGVVDLKATLAGGIAALFAAGQAMGAVAPPHQRDADLLQQDGKRNDDGDKSRNHDDDDKDNDHHDRGGRPSGYRHDRDPNMRDSKDDSSETTNDAESTGEDAAPSDGEAAPTEGNAAPGGGGSSTSGGTAPVVNDASGGDNIQEGTLAPAATPVPSLSVAPIPAAPSDVDFVS